MSDEFEKELDENDPMNGLGEWGEQPDSTDEDDGEQDEYIRLRDNY